MKILLTGGAGFIGSAVARMLIGETEDEVLVLDKGAAEYYNNFFK